MATKRYTPLVLLIWFKSATFEQVLIVWFELSKSLISQIKSAKLSVCFSQILNSRGIRKVNSVADLMWHFRSIYSRLSTSRSPRDFLKYFKIPVQN